MKYNYFNFKPFKDKLLITNDFGKFVFIEPDDLRSILAKNVDLDYALGKSLLESKMIYNEADVAYSANHRYDMREIKGFLGSATALHIFVVTTACNMNCVYCQANNGTNPSHLFMDEQTAERAVDLDEKPIQGHSTKSAKSRFEILSKSLMLPSKAFLKDSTKKKRWTSQVIFLQWKSLCSRKVYSIRKSVKNDSKVDSFPPIKLKPSQWLFQEKTESKMIFLPWLFHVVGIFSILSVV